MRSARGLCRWLADAAIGIMLAAIINALSKGVLAMALGGRKLGKEVGRALFGMLLSGGVALALVSLFAHV